MFSGPRKRCLSGSPSCPAFRDHKVRAQTEWQSDSLTPISANMLYIVAVYGHGTITHTHAHKDRETDTNLHYTHTHTHTRTEGQTLTYITQVHITNHKHSIAYTQPHKLGHPTSISFPFKTSIAFTARQKNKKSKKGTSLVRSKKFKTISLIPNSQRTLMVGDKAKFWIFVGYGYNIHWIIWMLSLIYSIRDYDWIIWMMVECVWWCNIIDGVDLRKCDICYW